VENLAESPAYPAGRALAERVAYRTTLSVPLLRDSVALGAITIRRTEILPWVSWNPADHRLVFHALGSRPNGRRRRIFRHNRASRRAGCSKTLSPVADT